MDDRTELARAELLDALTRAGVTPGRAHHLVAELLDAAHDWGLAESVDATYRDLEALAPRLNMHPDTLIRLAERRTTGADTYEPHVVVAVTHN